MHLFLNELNHYFEKYFIKHLGISKRKIDFKYRAVLFFVCVITHLNLFCILTSQEESKLLVFFSRIVQVLHFLDEDSRWLAHTYCVHT